MEQEKETAIKIIIGIMAAFEISIKEIRGDDKEEENTSRNT